MAQELRIEAWFLSMEASSFMSQLERNGISEREIELPNRAGRMGTSSRILEGAQGVIGRFTARWDADQFMGASSGGGGVEVSWHLEKRGEGIRVAEVCLPIPERGRQTGGGHAGRSEKRHGDKAD